LEPETTEKKEDVSERIKGLEKQLAEKDLALSQADARLAEMETADAKLKGDITKLKEQNTVVSGNFDELKTTLSETVKSYRELVLKSNPGVPAELVTGDTLAAVGESLAKAKELVGRVRQNIEAEIAESRIPAGAPVRTPRDISSLSAHEKIAQGIKRD